MTARNTCQELVFDWLDNSVFRRIAVSASEEKGIMQTIDALSSELISNERRDQIYYDGLIADLSESGRVRRFTKERYNLVNGLDVVS
ncbi:unnamed protein product [Echinostoma caproni]|uniref:ATP-dependent DNA helicase n=1 Tax=Echinostoma caproni TaxID=27848 RepID=A0A183ASG8_9TREM|nr:unnamed protein product [Echinostoma caproni]